MELHQLEYFVAVVEEGGFTRAAEKLRVAQPGVSAQVRRLERELGQELLDRSGRSVRVTEVGAAVLPYARAALAAVVGARLAVDEMVGLVRGRVAVGMVTSHSVPLPELLAGFHRDHPDVEITLAEHNSDLLIAGLREGTLDAAIVALGAAEPPPDLDCLIVVDERIFAAVGHEDVWAGRDSVTVAELRERALISLPLGTGLRACLDDACAAAGFAPQIAFEAGTPMMLAQLAARGLGVAILPRTVATSRDELHPVPIIAPELRGRLAFAWRATGPRSPAARALIGRARALFTPDGG